ncbi:MULTISPECIES: LIC_10190 family membrane protein [unclassified Chryseobacterium]|uniref:LIC_10190 family membrane protein n=1 Tax=unclassified Chryseobacterium TaxID=2593645 RepID=UPI0030189D5F
MILLFFSTLLLLPVLMGIGKITENFSGKLWEGVSGKIFLGILGISLLWTIAAFFIPLNSYVEFSTIAIGLIYFFKDRLYKDFTAFSKKDFSLIAAISLIIVYCGSFYPYILDHFGYYVPTIKWLKELGLVKGISNLDLTLGQMSVWHIFQAGFSNFSDPFLRINSVVLIIYTLYIIEKKSWIQLCFIPVLLLFCQSPSPDLPVIIFSVIILNEILRGNKQTTLLFAFSVFVFIIKPTMIWLPVLSFLYSVFILKSSLKNLIFGILIGFLFFVKNIYTFGYPVFPVSIIDLGVSWKPNPEVLKISSQFAIQKTYDMQYSYKEIQKFSAIDYIRNWIFLNGIKAKINLLFIISLIILTVFTFIKKNRIITFICISLIIKSILVLLFSAQYRFFMDVFFVIFFILFTDYFNQKKSLIVFSGLSIIFVSFLTFPNILQTYFPSFNPGNFMGKFEKEQFYKPSVYESTKFDSFRVGNLNFNVSSNYPFNYDSKIPAISAGYVSQDEKLGIFPQLIDDKNLKKGFVWKKLNNEEGKQAKSVIYTINPRGK